MKRNMIITAMAAVATVGLMQSATFADSMPYEPVFETEPITENVTSTPITTTKVTPINNISTPAATSVETENLQNALLQLDGAQVEIRNQLIQYRNEYTDLDTQYKTLKEKRALKAKQIRETEKRIKNIDSIKEKTRKNMN